MSLSAASIAAQAPLPAPIGWPSEEDPYYTIKGERLIRVTKPLECIPKPHLNNWFAREPAKVANAAYVQLQEAVRSGENIDWALFDGLFDADYLASVPFSYRNWKGDIGLVTHKAAYDWAFGRRVSKGDLFDYVADLVLFIARTEPDFVATPEDCMAYVEARLSFNELTKPVYEAVGAEAVVVSFANRHAGRCDGFGVAFAASDQDPDEPTGREILDLIKRYGDGERVRCLVDDKCSNHQGREWRYQLAGYGHSDAIILAADGSEHELPAFDVAVNCWVRPVETGERTRLIVQPCGEIEYETFLAARDLWEGVHNESARVRLSRAKAKEPPVRLTARPCPFGHSQGE